ncbi:MAG: glycosyltransferase N-terminal domain-containing protein [bacterium]
MRQHFYDASTLCHFLAIFGESSSKFTLRGRGNILQSDGQGRRFCGVSFRPGYCYWRFMSLFVYNLLLILLSPLIYLLMVWRRSRGKESEASWQERWGDYSDAIANDPRRLRIWVHAVSVGEVMAAVSVLKELRRRWPDALILLSTTTAGGREVALKQCPPADYVTGYPLDFASTVNRALSVVRPDIVLLMEWEIWPNFLNCAHKRGARIAVLNGRISDKGLRRGRKSGFFTRPGLDAVDVFLMQSAEDARRAALVGVSPEKIHDAGNTKFDESATMLTLDERLALRRDLKIPQNAPVWVCGSTRPGEEAIIAEALAAVRERIPGVALIIAPRHLERAEEVTKAFTERGFTVRRRSSPLTEAISDEVLLLDTFGELARVYAVADCAFVGGSLAPFGGQSVFQPLAQGVPVVFGPYMNNQRDISSLSKADGVAFEVSDAQMLASEVIRLISLSPEEKSRLSEKARHLIERNQGVSVRCVDEAARLLAEKSDGAR